MKTVQVRQTRHVGHSWGSKDVLLWTSSHGQAKVGWPARTYIQQVCANTGHTGCSPEDRLVAMDNREGWWERVIDIHADGVRWWW